MIRSNWSKYIEEICFNGLIRGIGKVLLLVKIGFKIVKKERCKFAFVCKQTAFLVVHINNIGQ